MAERQVLGDPISIRLINFSGLSERTAALGVFRRHQMPFASAHADDFPAASDLEALGHSLPRFNSLRTSHKS